MSTATSEKRQFCTFFLGDRLFGVEVLRVQEVIRYHEVTAVPLAARVVHGLLNLRGSIVTTVDMRRRFNMEPLDGDTLPANVVCHTPDGLVSLLVDRIGDVVEVDYHDFEHPPENLQGCAQELIEGIFKLPKGLLSILNIEAALSFETASAASRL